jgi:hypothetical protein
MLSAELNRKILKLAPRHTVKDDALHLSLNAPFTLIGETLVGREQARLIGSDYFGLIMLSEVVGQVLYFIEHGDFPVDQVHFLVNYLKSKH